MIQKPKATLQLDWKIAVLAVVSTLLLLVDHYYTLTSRKELDRTVLYLLVPLLITLFVFRESPREYGFQLGDWKAGIAITAVSILVIAPILWFVTRGDPTMTLYYRGLTGGLPWNTLIDLLGWEFMFRGWLLFGYARRFGPEAIWMQAVPFALAHLGKPAVETLSTIFGGFAFGWVAYRTRSFLYPFLIHWFVSSFVILIAAGILG
jgi:membrane protease YdiL (CAAX protease family)